MGDPAGCSSSCCWCFSFRPQRGTPAAASLEPTRDAQLSSVRGSCGWCFMSPWSLRLPGGAAGAGCRASRSRGGAPARRLGKRSGRADHRCACGRHLCSPLAGASADGHPVRGEFGFTIEPDAAGFATTDVRKLAPSQHYRLPPSTTRLLPFPRATALARVPRVRGGALVHLVGMLGVIGAVAFRWLVLGLGAPAGAPRFWR